MRNGKAYWPNGERFSRILRTGNYPFRETAGGIKLSRADVEWLLATYESGGIVGPVDWSDTKQRQRKGIDLRGADLGGVDLRGLPLAGMLGGLTQVEAQPLARYPRRLASVNLEYANLARCHLEGAILARASLRRADSNAAHLERAELYSAHIEDANLNQTRFDGANLCNIFLDDAAYLHGTSLSGKEFGAASLADVRWGTANLATVQWGQMARLGDEQAARNKVGSLVTGRLPTTRLSRFQAAVRANRQVSLVLKNQGLDEYANRYAYRAQVCQRAVLRLQHKYLRCFGSWLLDAVSGYGYAPLRSLIAYVFIICLFAGAYLLNAQFAAPHLTWDESLVLSISSFHGRGFFTSGISLGDTLARLAAGEAIIGLLIEITFIATFTQRFFAR